MTVRMFEFTDGRAAKFWHVERAGPVVTVRFGRLGTAGQTQVKDLVTEAAAVAHVDKLVAGKTRKGYAESGATVAPPPAPPASRPPAARAAAAPAAEPAPVPVASPPVDEDTFVRPAEWSGLVLARHDLRAGAGTGVPMPAAALAKAENRLDKLRDKVLGHLNGAGTDLDLADAGRRYLDDPAGGSALGASAVVAVLLRVGYHDESGWIADLLVSRHGPRFAVEAVMGTIPLGVVHQGYGRGPDDIPLTRLIGRPFAAHWSERRQVLASLRTWLASLADEQYADVVDLLAAHRDKSLDHRVAASFLAPTRSAWVDADCAEIAATGHGVRSSVMLAAASTAQQLAMVFPRVRRKWERHVHEGSADFFGVYTAVDTTGPAMAGHLRTWLDDPEVRDDDREAVAGILAAVPSDEAFEGLLVHAEDRLVRPSLLAAAARCPRRAMRVFAAAAAQRTAGELLRAHVLSDLDRALAMLPDLPAAAAARVRAIADPVLAAGEATGADLPPILVTPPWTVSRARHKPVVVEGLACSDGPGIDWAPGELDEWGRIPYWVPSSCDQPETDWDGIAASLRSVRTSEVCAFFLVGPEHLARPLLDTWQPEDIWDAGSWGKRLVARFGLATYPMIFEFARRNSATAAETLLPFTGPQVAALMADWFSRLKTARAVAHTWLTRHPQSAARALILPALGPGAGRRAAEQALRAVAAVGHRETVLAAAREYGPAALDGAETLLALDPLDALPDRMPATPGWVNLAGLPRIVLRDGGRVLPTAAAQHLVTMLAISKRGEPYPGVAIVRDACEPSSLAEFAWALFRNWQAAGTPAKESWALDALGLLGDDEVVRRLAPVIRAWPGDGGHARAVIGLDILTEIGTVIALMNLHGIAQKVKFQGLKQKANQKVNEVARALGLTRDQLADRLVPDFGLDHTGSLTLDFGPRRFVVGFDEQLRPQVVDEGGKHRASLPKPSVKDDPELAAEAQRRFAALKKDVRTVAADQLRRLEQSMVAQRRWPAADFRRYLVGHPLVWHLVRRLVWMRFAADGTPLAALRVAEDRTFADADDNPVELPDDATVGVAHPLHLGEGLAAWAEVFTDYEILQPFPQLGREIHRLDPRDAEADELTRYTGRKLPTTTVLGLERRGWQRGFPMDGGVQCWLERDLPDGRLALIDLDPGIVIGDITMFDEQKLEAIRIDTGYRFTALADRPPNNLRTVDPVALSELIRDLEHLVS